jgi:hypothetical protein
MSVLEQGISKSNGPRGGPQPNLRLSRTLYVLAALVIVGLIVGAIVYARRPPPVSYITAPVVRKELLQTMVLRSRNSPTLRPFRRGLAYGRKSRLERAIGTRR